MFHLIWKFCAALAAVTGAASATLLWSRSSVLGVLLMGGLVVALVLWCSRESEGKGSRFARSAKHGFLISFAVVAAGGLCSLLSSAGALLSIALVLTAPPVVRRAAAFARSRGWLTGAADAVPADAARVQTMSTAEICQAWTASCAQLRQVTPRSLPVVRLRQLYLDELERRDPVGLNAWLSSTASAAGDPRRYLSP
jgi:hypothetical protein